ncbi:MAG: hypothetical protein COB14_06690 [Alphaproteobacteria bacterium]|nr:MAG: hypothetical protein COB14_06690 [Alphaproteobacteria bacterium]
MTFGAGDKIGALADIIPYLDHDLFDENKWKNESDKSKFSRFQMINTTRMLLREIWLSSGDREMFKKKLSVSYRTKIEALNEESGLFDKTHDSLAPKRPYPPDVLINKWQKKDPLFSGKEFDKLIDRFARFSENENVAFVQSFSRRRTSGQKNELKEEFRQTKRTFLKQLANECEFELLGKGVPSDVVSMMKDGVLPAGKGYDIEHMKDRSLGGDNRHNNLCFVDRLYNEAAADLTSLQTLSLLPGCLRTIYEPVPKAFNSAANQLQEGTSEYLDGYTRADPNLFAIVPLQKRILISGVLERDVVEPT